MIVFVRNPFRVQPAPSGRKPASAVGSMTPTTKEAIPRRVAGYVNEGATFTPSHSFHTEAHQPTPRRSNSPPKYVGGGTSSAAGGGVPGVGGVGGGGVGVKMRPLPPQQRPGGIGGGVGGVGAGEHAMTSFINVQGGASPYPNKSSLSAVGAVDVSNSGGRGGRGGGGGENPPSFSEALRYPSIPPKGRRGIEEKDARL